MPLAAGEVGHGGDVFYRVSCMVEGSSSTRGGTVFERATKKIACGQLVLAVDVCAIAVLQFVKLITFSTS